MPQGVRVQVPPSAHPPSTSAPYGVETGVLLYQNYVVSLRLECQPYKIVKFYSNNRGIFVLSQKTYNIFMEKDYSLLAQGLEKTFQNWFSDPVPPDIPFPATDIFFPGEVDFSSLRTPRKRVDNLERVSELLEFGFQGAVFLGIVVVFIITYLSVWGWYSADWTDPIVVIILVVVIGFFGGMYRGVFYKLRDRKFYKDEG